MLMEFVLLRTFNAIFPPNFLPLNSFVFRGDTETSWSNIIYWAAWRPELVFPELYVLHYVILSLSLYSFPCIFWFALMGLLLLLSLLRILTSSLSNPVLQHVVGASLTVGIRLTRPSWALVLTLTKLNPIPDSPVLRFTAHSQPAVTKNSSHIVQIVLEGVEQSSCCRYHVVRVSVRELGESWYHSAVYVCLLVASPLLTTCTLCVFPLYLGTPWSLSCCLVPWIIVRYSQDSSFCSRDYVIIHYPLSTV